MKKIIISIIVIGLLLMTSIVNVDNSVAEEVYEEINSVRGNTIIGFDDWDIIVDDDGGGHYTSVQDAIDAAWPGCRILVKSGTYGKITVNKPDLTIHGEDKETTIIDGGGGSKNDVVGIRSNGINISGFTLQNSGDGAYHDDWPAGIDTRSSYNTITDNKIRNNARGIYLIGSHTIISGNIITNSIFDGIDVPDGSSNLTITNNTIRNVEYFLVNDGIHLYHVHSSIISLNKISKQYVGIDLTCGNDNIFSENIIENCIDTGLLIIGESDYNVIYHNNLKNNLQNTFDNTKLYDRFNNKWYNPELKEGNYYDNYRGFDIFRPRGIGDLPYLIRPLLIIIAEVINLDRYPLMNPYDGGVVVHNQQISCI